MPSKNVIKIYVKGGIYHIYNRGIETRDIFLDEQDYKIFLYYLKSFLTPLDEQSKPPIGIRYGHKNNFTIYKEIYLFAFCLMSNHFHLLVKQSTERAISEFMKRLSNAYTEYFNKKYPRVGPIFQGSYKAALVEKEFYFLHLSRYIHGNPRELFENIEDFRKYSYSSYLDYLGERHTNWVHPEEILEYFEKRKGKLDEEEFSSYQNFVETYTEDRARKVLGKLMLD